jgi:O-antigen/teichoic acid export membrane protein
MTDSDLGLYNCAMRIVSFSFILPDSLITASYPHFSRLWLEKTGVFEKKTLSYCLMLMALGFLGAAGMAFFGGTLLEVFFGAKYAPSGPLMALLGFMLPANCLNGLFGYLFQATHHEKTALAMVFVSTLVVFSVLALGTALWGLTGAGVGSVVSIWIMSLLYIVMARKVWRLDLSLRSPVVRSIAVFAAGWLLIAMARPADNLTYCLAASAVGLAAIILGGLSDALIPRRIKDVFN